jgi:hypothetical protein
MTAVNTTVITIFYFILKREPIVGMLLWFFSVLLGLETLMGILLLKAFRPQNLSSVQSTNRSPTSKPQAPFRRSCENSNISCNCWRELKNTLSARVFKCRFSNNFSNVAMVEFSRRTSATCHKNMFSVLCEIGPGRILPPLLC